MGGCFATTVGEPTIDRLRLPESISGIGQHVVVLVRPYVITKVSIPCTVFHVQMLISD